jgi:unsaturated rhamnogalacturonyl hydrolase
MSALHHSSLSPEAFEGIALRAFHKHASLYRFEHYAGILSLHGLARLAARTGSPEHLQKVRMHLLPFCEGRMTWKANFPLYFCGGAASAYLHFRGHLPEAEAAILQRAEEQGRQPRDSEGLFSHPMKTPDHIWIDTIFAVTPFFLYAGLAFNRPEWLDEAVSQTLGHLRVLRDPETGLIHQCRGFVGPGILSADHWSRGNGWALHALAALILDLPADHSQRHAVEEVFRDLCAAVLRFQGPEGLWRQEMTEPGAYIETSGSMLIVQALGAGVEAGLLGEESRSAISRGLREAMTYMMPDGSIFHCCQGCLCPFDGSKIAYMATGPILNDPHAFGSYIHAFEQAMGIFPSTTSPSQ